MRTLPRYFKLIDISHPAMDGIGAGAAEGGARAGTEQVFEDAGEFAGGTGSFNILHILVDCLIPYLDVLVSLFALFVGDVGGDHIHGIPAGFRMVALIARRDLLAEEIR